MKKQITLIFPFIFLLFACDKDMVESFSLSDKWKLAISCGGIAGCLPANSVTTIEFNGNDIIEQAKDSQASPPTYYKKSAYTVLDVTHEDSKASYQVQLEDGTIYLIDVSAEQLVVTDGMHQKIYKKQYPFL